MKKLLLVLFTFSLSGSIYWEKDERRYYSTHKNIDQYSYHILALYVNCVLRYAVEHKLSVSKVMGDIIDGLIKNGSKEALALLDDLNLLWSEDV